MKETLQFLAELSGNNNRDWFTANKERYTACRKHFERFSEDYIRRLTVIDPTLEGLTPKDCIWRIYRDVRFSADKRPYKEWFGVFPAQHGGKKSMHAGYYFHIQPGHCLFAGGIWCPSPDLLKTLRREILANWDEVNRIMTASSWQRYFGDFDTDWMLKKVPPELVSALDNLRAGNTLSTVASDRLEGWLKRKAFTFSTPLTDEAVCAPDLLDRLAVIAAAAKPMNDFLNYTFEEYGEFPCR